MSLIDKYQNIISKSELTEEEKLFVATTPEEISGFHFLSHYIL